ncbi:MAG: glycosyltransferase family 2 protein [Candidatus Binatia bacterium]
MDASIIIVSYNTRDLTLSCLASVIKHTVGLSYEVVVVDNASSDGSAEAIEQQFPSVRVYRSPQNLGFAGGVSRAVSYCSGEFLFLFNSDAYLQDNAFNAMITYVRQNSHVGALGCRVTSVNGSHQPTAGRFPSLWLDFSDHVLRPLAFLPARWRQNCIHADDFQQPVSVDWLAGSCVLLRRQALEEVGGMDEQFFLGDEDIDLGYRLKRAGWQVVYFPAVGVVHLGGRSKEFNPRSAYYFFLGRYRFYQKHYSNRYAQLFRSLLLFSYGLRWFGTWVTFAAKNREFRQARRRYTQYWRDVSQWPWLN